MCAWLALEEQVEVLQLWAVPHPLKAGCGRSIEEHRQVAHLGQAEREGVLPRQDRSHTLPSLCKLPGWGDPP